MNVAAYVRYSSDNQREESIDAQIRAINEYCAREGHVVIKIYADEARSATTDNRPEFQKMISEAASRKFGAIIVHKLDRFSRDRYDSAYYRRQLKLCDVRLISVLENLNDSPESIILESVLEGMAEYYSRNLAREVMKGMRETAYNCKHTGGIPPLGYDVAADKSYTINVSESEAVKLIFNMYAAGSGYSPIIDACAEKGYKTKTGRPFGKNSLYSILSNEKYVGTYIFNKTERKIAGKRNGHRIKPEEEIIRIEGGIPAIIDKSVWERVRKRMGENKNTQASYKAKVVYLLSGKIFCGKCGSSMLGKTGKLGRDKTPYSYYECGARKRTRSCDMKPINSSFIDRLVLETLYNSMFCPEAIDAAADKMFAYATEQKKQIPTFVKSAGKQLASVELEIKHMVDAISKGMFQDSMKEKMDDLETSRAALQIRIAEAEQHEHIYSLSKTQIRNFLSRYSNLLNDTADNQRAAVELWVHRVVVFDDDINIELVETVSVDYKNGEDGQKVGIENGAARLHHK